MLQAIRLKASVKEVFVSDLRPLLEEPQPCSSDILRPLWGCVGSKFDRKARKMRRTAEGKIERKREELRAKWRGENRDGYSFLRY